MIANPFATIARVVRRPPARSIAAIAAVVVLALVGVGCGGQGDTTGPPDQAAISVGKVTITNAQVERRATVLATGQQDDSGRPIDPPSKDSDAYWELRRTAGAQLRDQAVMNILADRCGAPCVVKKQDVNDLIASIVKEQFNGSDAAYKKGLADRGYTEQDLRDQLLAGLREEKLIARQQLGVTFTEAQAKAYYDKNVAQYKTPAEKRLSHILVATKAVAASLRPQLTAANFADTAKSRSLDAAAKTTGGDLGPVAGAGLIPELAAAAAGLKAGTISQPIETQFGWHLLLVQQVPASTKAFDEVRATILAEQLQAAQVKKVDAWRNTTVKKLTDSAKFVNTKIAPPAPTTATTLPATTAATTTATTATATP